MKKQVLLFLLMLMPLMASADAVEVDGIYYNLNTSAKTAEVTFGTTKYSLNVIIPSSINYQNTNYKVTKIGNKAFYDCSKLTSVSIPNSVISFGEYAFYCCTGMKSIIIPNSVTTINRGAFCGCRMTSLIIPNSVTTIDVFAFEYCSSLTSIMIGNGVTSIGEGAFEGCSSLTSITIPKNVKNIGKQVLRDCFRLTSVQVEQGNTSYDSRDNCNAIINTASNKLIAGCKNTIIPNNVTSIDQYAFIDIRSLISINIPQSVNNINNSAFVRCNYLKRVYCHAKKAPITGNSAFYDSNITNATLYVPTTSTEQYKAVTPWNEFGSIVGLPEYTLTYMVDGKIYKIYTLFEGENVISIPDPIKEGYVFSGWTEIPTTMPGHNVTITGSFRQTPQCAKPNIILNANGKIIVESDTEGATCITNISASNANPIIYNTFKFNEMLTVFSVTAYATAEGYYDSEKAFTTFNWNKNEADLNEDGIVNIVDVIQLVNKIFSWNRMKNLGMLTYEVSMSSTNTSALQCVTPVITLLANGKIKVESATEGATCVTNITASNAEPLTDGEISLNTPLTVYTVTSYATKEGYDDSEVATATFRYEKAEGDINGDGNLNISDVVQLVNMILGQ